MRGDSPSQSNSADDVVQLIYPQNSLISRVGPGGAARKFIAIPTWQEARMIFPADPFLSSMALRRARRTISARDRARTVAASLALRAGVGRALGEVRTFEWTGGSLEAELSELFGCPIAPAIFLGPPRANRKPVIQIMSMTGRLLGVAKVGTSDLSSRLVRNEAKNLASLRASKFATLIHPTLLGLIDWQGRPVAVQSPLPVWEQGLRDDAAVRTNAMREIAQSAGTATTAWWGSAHQLNLTKRIGEVGDRDLRTLMRDALHLGVGRNTTATLGSWHGDLSAWNMAVEKDRRAMIWDWERYASNVPVGFDALHYEFTPMLKRSPADRARSGIEIRERAHIALAPFIADRARPTDVAVMYLIEIASRYANDGQAQTGVAGGDAAAWLRPIVELLRGEDRHG